MSPRRGFVCATWLAIASLACVAWVASANAQAPVFIEDFAFDSEQGAARIEAVTCGNDTGGKRAGGCVAKIGDVVSLQLRNLSGWLEKLKTDKVITSGEAGDALVIEQLPNMRLFIGGHLMRTLQPTRYTKDEPSWYLDNLAQSKEALGRAWLEFALKREPANKESRADWDEVLKTSGLSPRMPLALGIYNANRNTAHIMALPVGENTPDPLLEFRFQRIGWDWWTISGLILLVAAAIVFFYLSVRSGMVRDTNCPVRADGLPPFSLGRCQMAFWFFLVICAFYFLWLITGRGDTDTINSTVLILIGISAGTALGSAIVSNNEVAASASAGQFTANRPPLIYPEEINKAKALLAQAKMAKDPVGIQNQTSEIARLKAELKLWRAQHRIQFLLDLLSEEDTSAGSDRVITFHRFQIVVWTLILGVIFVSEVLTKLVMPTFDSTLLALMGISSGTYLGFRVASK